MKKITFYIITFLLMLVLLAAKIPYLFAGILALMIAIAAYIFFNVRNNNSRLRLLNQECDPEAFIKSTEQQINLNKTNTKAVTYLNIDKSAGLISLGRFFEAKELLHSLEIKYLSPDNGSQLVYDINLLTCMYELNEIQDAEEYYEKNIPSLLHKNPKLSLAFDLFLAERYFFVEEYNKSEELLKEILQRPISKRARLSVLHRLALIDLEFNRISQAQEKLKEVAEDGNKIHITHKSIVLLSTLTS